mmetsp:Transcript_138296/g.240667  ORF Transcript_138296/g.240667 Transcript_138296/m.240667 type:complete len:226 (+) Transcript_138296:175-852(+)
MAMIEWIRATAILAALSLAVAQHAGRCRGLSDTGRRRLGQHPTMLMIGSKLITGELPLLLWAAGQDIGHCRPWLRVVRNLYHLAQLPTTRRAAGSHFRGPRRRMEAHLGAVLGIPTKLDPHRLVHPHRLVPQTTTTTPALARGVCAPQAPSLLVLAVGRLPGKRETSSEQLIAIEMADWTLMRSRCCCVGGIPRCQSPAFEVSSRPWTRTMMAESTSMSSLTTSI